MTIQSCVLNLEQCIFNSEPSKRQVSHKVQTASPSKRKHLSEGRTKITYVLFPANTTCLHFDRSSENTGVLINRYAHIPHSLIILFFMRIKRKFYWEPMYSQYFCSIDIYPESLCDKRKWATYTLVDHLGESAKRRRSQKTFLDHLFAKSKAILVGYIYQLSMAVKNMTWRTMGNKVIITILPEEKSGQRLKAGHGGRHWSRGHGGTPLTRLLSMACSDCLLCNPGLLTHRWHHPHWVRISHISHLIKKTPPRLV